MKIIIIGNGFDLNLGLKTGYQDFIASDYFKSLIKEDNSLATYLINKNELNNWVDIEEEITRYSVQVQENDLNVKNDFKALKTALMNYLKEAQKEEINQDSKAFKMIENEIHTADKIYNFNYTDSVFKIAKLLDIQDIENKHSYVHGSIEKSDIIFGVEDNAKINPDHIFFRKAYYKNFGESDIDNFLKDDNYNKNILVVFGHSLGITDSAYFKPYISLLSIHKRMYELKFYYYGEIGYDEMMKTLDYYTNNHLTKFKHYNIFTPIDSSQK